MAKNAVVNPANARGFSIVEIMVALTIAGILLSTAVPSFNSAIQNNRLVTQINELNTSISTARSEAIKRGVSVSMCSSNNGLTCRGAWKDGWVVFVDNDSDGVLDRGEEVVRVNGKLPGSNTLSFTQTKIVFANSGFAINGANGAFLLCDERGSAHAKGLLLGPSGHPRLAMDSDEDGAPENASNQDMSCSS